jgi:hypothetical protein
MKKLTEPSSGKRGNKVAFKSRFDQCEREVPSRRKKRRSAAQCRDAKDFGGASSVWNDLTEEQWKAWNAAGEKVKSHPSGEGQCGPLTGQNFCTAINRNQALIGQPPILDPPARPVFGPNPVGGLSITQGRGGIALKLSVSTAPAAHILVYGARPYNAGRKYCDKFVFLGLLPPPAGGESDITKQYVKKYGKPRPGSRVNIGTVQQVNGWRDEPTRSLKRTYAIFRVKPGPAGKPKRRRGTVAAP